MFTRRVRELVARTKPYMRWILFHKRNYTWKSWHFLRGATTTTRYASWNRQGAPSIDLYNKQTVLIFLGHLWVVFLFYYYYYSRFSGSVCRSFGPDSVCLFLLLFKIQCVGLSVVWPWLMPYLSILSEIGGRPWGRRRWQHRSGRCHSNSM